MTSILAPGQAGGSPPSSPSQQHKLLVPSSHPGTCDCIFSCSAVTLYIQQCLITSFPSLAPLPWTTFTGGRCSLAPDPHPRTWHWTLCSPGQPVPLPQHWQSRASVAAVRGTTMLPTAPFPLCSPNRPSPTHLTVGKLMKMVSFVENASKGQAFS